MMRDVFMMAVCAVLVVMMVGMAVDVDNIKDEMAATTALARDAATAVDRLAAEVQSNGRQAMAAAEMWVGLDERQTRLERGLRVVDSRLTIHIDDGPHVVLPAFEDGDGVE